jgi:2-haloacid dehalogenase
VKANLDIAIIFDFGNVLVKWDAHGVYKRFFPNPHAIDAFLQEINFSKWNEKQDAGRSFAEGAAELSAQFPHYSRLIHAYYENWEDSITEVLHDTVAIVKQLKKLDYPLYLLSNFSAETFPLMRRRFDFVSIFDDIIISGEVGLVKPDPEIFKLTLERVKRPAQHCLFIDDSLPNIETAKQLGFQTIHFASAADLETELRSMEILYAENKVL